MARTLTDALAWGMGAHVIVVGAGSGSWGSDGRPATLRGPRHLRPAARGGAGPRRRRPARGRGGTHLLVSPEPATVDVRGAVLGTRGLRVADASVIPDVLRADTHLTTVAIAERIARDIRGRAVAA